MPNPRELVRRRIAAGYPAVVRSGFARPMLRPFTPEAARIVAWLVPAFRRLPPMHRALIAPPRVHLDAGDFWDDVSGGLGDLGGLLGGGDPGFNPPPGGAEGDAPSQDPSWGQGYPNLGDDTPINPGAFGDVLTGGGSSGQVPWTTQSGGIPQGGDYFPDVPVSKSTGGATASGGGSSTPSNVIDPATDGPTYLHACTLLALWCRATTKMTPPPCDPPDFGQGDASPDLTTYETPRSKRAISSFQKSAQAAGRKEITRTDGVLDVPTYDALLATGGSVLVATSAQGDATAQKTSDNHTAALWIGGGVVALGLGVAFLSTRKGR